MTAADGLLIFVRSGAVLVVALLVTALARRNPALRVAAARYGLLGALVVSLSAPWAASRPRPLVEVPSAFPAVAYSPSAGRVRVVPTPVPEPVAPATVPSATVPSATLAPPDVPLDVLGVFMPAWAAGAALLGLHLLLGAVALGQVTRRCRPVARDLSARVGALAKEIGIAAPAVLEGEGVAGPCVAGVRRATVLLPLGWAEGTDVEVVDAVLRHELAHVANGDLRWGLFARLVRILLWPQPLVWLLRRPSAAAEEEACDRQVLAAGVSQARYAAGLLELREGRRAVRVPSLAIGAVSRRSGFGRRIEAILAFRGRGGARLSRRAGWAVRTGALVLALGAAFAFAHPGVQTADPTTGGIKAPYEGAVDLVDEKGNFVGVGKAWIVIWGDASTPIVWTPEFLGSTIRLPYERMAEGSTGVLAVRAKSPGHGLTMVRLWPAPSRIRQVRVASPASLRGRFLLPDGRPAAGVRVAVPMLFTPVRGSGGAVVLHPRGVPGLMPTAVTDATGTFQLDGLPQNTYVEFDADDPRYAQLSLNDQATTGFSGVTDTKTVRLKAAGRISGRVTRDGRPVAGVRIGAQANTHRDQSDIGAWGDATTDGQGRYTIGRLGPTVYNVSTQLSDRLETEVTARAHEGVTIRPGADVTGIDFDLTPGSVVEGTVFGPDGKPLAGTAVAAYGPAHPSSSAGVQLARVDATGHYRLRVPAGAQEVYPFDERFEPDVKHVTTKNGATTHLDFRARLKPASTFEPGPPHVALSVDEPSFYGPARLPNGAKVRLAFVQDGPKGGRAWAPDGRLAPAADRGGALDMTDPTRWRTKERSRHVFLRVDVEGVTGGDAGFAIQVPGLPSWIVSENRPTSKGGERELAAIWMEESRRTVDARVGIAAGPYRTFASERVGQGGLVERIESGLKGDFKTPEVPPSALVTIRFPVALAGKDVRLAAFTKTGRRLPQTFWTDDAEKDVQSGDRVRKYGFSGGAASDVARVELRVRDYRWTTFRGIRLYPNGG